MQLEDSDDSDMSTPALKDVASLDACITVVDASNLMANLQSIKTLQVSRSCVDPDAVKMQTGACNMS